VRSSRIIADRLIVQNGWTPLHFAALGGKHEVAALLLDRGADREAMAYVRPAA
jgi:ankyrin repeat protein